MKRQISVAEAVQAASILYELNTKRDAILALATKAELKPAGGEESLLYEWHAFVHAAVLYGLMVQAPNIVVVEYLRATQTMLQSNGYSYDDALHFVDDAFSAYVKPLLHTQTQECPTIFFRRLEGKEISDVPSFSVALISGVMAMLFATVLDKLEMYEYLLD